MAEEVKEVIATYHKDRGVYILFVKGVPIGQRRYIKTNGRKAKSCHDEDLLTWTTHERDTLPPSIVNAMLRDAGLSNQYVAA